MSSPVSSSKRFPSLLAFVLVWSFAALSAAESKLPEISPEGLKLVQSSQMHAVYLRDGADFSGYDKVALLDCYVAFRKNWQRDQRSSSGIRVSDSDIMKIKNKLANEFKVVFSKSLAEKGTPVVESGGPGVLVLRPAIINLDVTAPDTMDARVSRTFSTSAGAMTLYLEVLDGVTGDLLARVIDPQKDRDYGSMSVRNGVTNRADADRILKKWADALGDYLQQARSSTSDLSLP